MKYQLIYILIFVFSLSVSEWLFSKTNQIHILFTESTNGVLQNCECPVQPYGGMARRKTLIDSLRSVHENVYLLDAGNFLSTFDRPVNDKKMLKLMHDLAYTAINFGQNETMYYASHNTIKPLCFVSLKGSHQVSSLEHKQRMLIEKLHCRVIILGIYTTLQYESLKQELSKISATDLLFILSQLSEDENKVLIDQFENKIDFILGNHSLDVLIGKWEKIKNTYVIKAGVDGQSVGHIQIDSSGLIDISFHKVKQSILPDPEFLKQINHLEASH